jgi:S1-C subfamily serine protease
MSNIEPDPYKEFEFPAIRDPKKSNWSKIRKFIKRSFRFFFVILIIFNLIATGLILQNDWVHSSNNDGYVPPDDLDALVHTVSASTVTIYCELSSKHGWQGSGFSADIYSKHKDRSIIITNYHVIEDCIKQSKPITVDYKNLTEIPAEILNTDPENDLAMLEIKKFITPLPFAQVKPNPGFWAMSVSSPNDYSNSVSIGNVVTIQDFDLLSSVMTGSGSSGGPLVDNTGYVIGVTTWSGIQEWHYSGSVSLDAFCVQLLECKGKDFGWEHWN